jgi:hypothetical protein
MEYDLWDSHPPQALLLVLAPSIILLISQQHVSHATLWQGTGIDTKQQALVSDWSFLLCVEKLQVILLSLDIFQNKIKFTSYVPAVMLHWPLSRKCRQKKKKSGGGRLLTYPKRISNLIEEQNIKLLRYIYETIQAFLKRILQSHTLWLSNWHTYVQPQILDKATICLMTMATSRG